MSKFSAEGPCCMMPHGHDEALRAERDALAEKVKGLEDDLEQTRVQLAGCGVAAMQNTERTIADRAKPGDYGWSASYSDVCRAVDREMALRTKLARAEDTLKTCLIRATEVPWRDRGHSCEGRRAAQAVTDAVDAYFARAAKESTEAVGMAETGRQIPESVNELAASVVQSKLARPGARSGSDLPIGHLEAAVEGSGAVHGQDNTAASSPTPEACVCGHSVNRHPPSEKCEAAGCGCRGYAQAEEGEQKCAYCGEMVDEHHDYKCVRSHLRPKTDAQPAGEAKCEVCAGTGCSLRHQHDTIVDFCPGRSCRTCNGTGYAKAGEG